MKIRNRIAIYGLVLGCLLAVWLNSSRYFRPQVYSVPSGKVVSYLAQKESYRVLFIGDSRTFTDIQPRTVSPLIGRPSYNLATFGLWMPVQYLEFQEVFPQVPQDTVVVWSLSHYNFAPIGDRWWIPGQYKFSLADAAEYVWDGYPVARILREYEESPYSPVDLLVKRREKWMSSFDQSVWSSDSGKPPDAENKSAEPNNVEAARILDRLKQDKNVIIANPSVHDGIATSIEAVSADGGYDRIVIDPAFFKKEQAQSWPARSSTTGCQFTANDVYMRTFGKILDLVSKYRLRMVVNYIEDAPGSWPSDSDRQCAKQFMAEKIVPLLAARGIAYMSPDLYPLIGFNNDLYFDSSHLKTEGAAIYSRLFASELAKVVASKGW